MLSWARRTSAAVENCWRTPPIAFAVAPLATRPAVAEHDVARAERGQSRRPSAGRPGARYDDSSHASSSRFSPAFSVRSGARTSSRTGTPRRPSTYLAAAWNGKRSSARP